MSKAEKIKAKIERLKNELSDNKKRLSLGEIIAVNNCYNNLILFIDSLSDTEKDFGIKNVGTVWHDANNVPTKKELCLIVYDCDNGPSLSNTEVVIANPLARRFVTCSYPHNTGKQYTVQGETPIQVDVYHSCRDYIPFSDVDKWAYISDLFNLNNSQEEPVSNDSEEASRNYADSVEYGDGVYFTIKAAFKAGTQWQKEQDQATIELAEDHAYLAGQEKIIAKACEWLENYFKGVSSGTIYLEDFKKAIKE